MRDLSIQTIRSYYDSFNQGDLKRFLDLLTEDVTHDINQGGIEVGKVAFHHFMEKMNRHYKEKAAELMIMANEAGTRASAEFFIDGVYLATDQGLPQARGQKYRLRCGAFFEFRGDKICRVTTYYNLADWLSQVE